MKTAGNVSLNPPPNNAACAAAPVECQQPIPTGFPNDWQVLVDQAINSNVCNQPGDGGKCNPTAP